MSGEPKLPESQPTKTASPTSIPRLLMGNLISMVFAFAFIGLAILWLYKPHATTLEWPSPGLFLVFGAFMASGAHRRFHGPGWGAVAMAALATTVMTAVLIVNVVAATVILWAIHPPAATGTDGFLFALLAGGLLSLPVVLGSYELPLRWRTLDLKPRDLFYNKRFRPRNFIGLPVGLAGTAALAAPALLLEAWLRGAFPIVAGDLQAGDGDVWILAVLLFIVTTAPSDLRSTLRSIMGALVGFEAVLAATITGLLASVTLQTNVVLVLLLELLLLMPVYMGAFVLVAALPKEDGSDATDIGHEEEGPA